MANLPLQALTNLWFQKTSSFELSLHHQNETINGFRATTKWYQKETESRWIFIYCHPKLSYRQIVHPANNFEQL
jgi:hypothetical protein